MNATSLLVSTTRLVMQAEANQANGTADSSNMSDLFRLVPYLRQSLSCTVCGRLLIEPYTPQATQCQHHVCRACLGGRKSLKPTCHSCRDYQTYEVNTTLRILLQCYKELCEYIVSKPMYSFVLKAGAAGQPLSAASNGNANTSMVASNSLVELIEEGVRFKDNYKSNSGLLKSTYSMLPCVYNTLPVIPSTLNQTAVHSQSTADTISSAPTPPFTQAPAIVAPIIQTIRPATVVTASASSSFANSSSSYSTMVDIKPDIKTLNIVRTTAQPSMLQSHQIQPQPTQIQMTNHQTQYHHQPIQVQARQKMWINTAANKTPTVRTQMIPVQTTTTYQVHSKSQPAQTVPTLTPMKTSNGSPMYSVMYAGTGNKITIKRKPDPIDTSDYPNIRINPPAPTAAVATTSSTSLMSTNTIPMFTDHKPVQTHHLPIPSSTIIRPHSVQLITNTKQPQFAQPKAFVGIQPQQFQTQIIQQNFKKPVVVRTKPMTAAAAAKRKGCRCGNATPTPGKLTCCGQRCPCYVDAKSCVDCKCRGCRNPHRADGFKVRPHIPELNTIEIIDNDHPSSLPKTVDMQQLVASNSSGSSGNSITLTTSTGFTSLPSSTTSSMFGSSASTSLVTTLGSSRLDGIDAATLQSLDQDSIVFNPDDVEDTNFQVVNVFASQMPSIGYSAVPTILVQNTIATPSTSFYSTTSTAGPMSATPQTNLLATDDDDEDEDDANDLISTTLRATPALVQKYRYPQPIIYATTNTALSRPPKRLVSQVDDDEEDDEEDGGDDDEEEPVTSDDPSDDADLDVS